MDTHDLVDPQTLVCDGGYMSEPESEYYGDISIIEAYQSEPGSVPSTQSNLSEKTASTTESDLTTSVAASLGHPTTLGKRTSSDISDSSVDVSAPPFKRPRIDDEFDAEPHVHQPVFIAHCPTAQSLIEERSLSRGVRHEVARLLSAGIINYGDITPERLDLLRGPNQEAGPCVAQVFLKTKLHSNNNSVANRAFARELAAKSPWEELDREEEALSHGPYEGLGNNDKYPGWYGGKVQFHGRLQAVDGKSKGYKVILDSCSLGPSSRFARRFGSWSFLRVKVPLSIFHSSDNDLLQYFKRPFIIWGQVFRSCYAKDDNVFLFCTNELFPFGPTIPGRLSFEEFNNWHNPLEFNLRQYMSKWAARTPLGFSNSVPGPRLLQENVMELDDVVSDQGSDMTDGCGLSSKQIHRFILNMLSLPAVPTAFQFRFSGFKGMCLIRDDGSADDETMSAWFRPSQTKIRYPPDLCWDPAMLTFDILRTSYLRTPSRLSTEVVINLAENGVPHDVFKQLLKDSIQQLVVGLTTWEGPDAMFNLWINVERAGGVLAGRRAREAVGEARARGYSNRSPEEDELEDDHDEDGLNEDSTPRSTAWWADYVSGCPSTLEETVMVLLDAGFDPLTSPILREKLKMVVNSKIENRLEKFRFEVPQSCVAFAVPDPYGVLGPDEVQIKSSRRNFKMDDGLLTDIVLGEVLVTRNPCKLPSDVRKVKAVDHPLLRNLVDVIVFSVKGYRRWIDFLAGGDYDGDTVLVIWAYLIVASFKNADDKYASEPAGLDLAFSRDTETGAAFLERIQPFQPERRIDEIQTYLLGGLVDTSLVGKYSNMHINAIYKLGYSHPFSRKLAAKFCRVLDAPKTGWRIKPSTYKSDKADYSHPLGPRWKAAKVKSKTPTYNYSNTISKYLKRGSPSSFIQGDFIMDVLDKTAKREKDRLQKEIDLIFEPLPRRPDPDLTRPWDDIVQWAQREIPGLPGYTLAKNNDLDTIMRHVKDVYKLSKETLAPEGGKGTHFSTLPIGVRQDRLRALSQAFVSGPKLEDLSTFPDEATLARCRASYAYKYDAGYGWNQRFSFNVAMSELCAIKAAAVGFPKVVQTSFYERFKLVERQQ